MFYILADDHAVAGSPIAFLAPNGDLAVDCDHDLDGMMFVRRHDPLAAANEQESAIP